VSRRLLSDHRWLLYIEGSHNDEIRGEAPEAYGKAPCFQIPDPIPSHPMTSRSMRLARQMWNSKPLSEARRKERIRQNGRCVGARAEWEGRRAGPDPRVHLRMSDGWFVGDWIAQRSESCAATGSFIRPTLSGSR
jgi:hypothetical protein